MENFICFVLLFIFVIVAIIIGSCGLPADHQVKKLDPAGNTWYIWAKDEPTKYVDKTCETIGRSVLEVTLAGRYATKATVRCGK